MAENKPFFLCGGVLFFLLTEAALPDGSAKDHEAGIADEHSDPILMRDFIYAFCGSTEYGTQKDTSLYKDCQIEGGKNIPFDAVRLCSGYDQEVRKRYDTALLRMDQFVRWHIDPKAKEWLVKAVLEIIDRDEKIDKDELLFISPNGIPMPKADVFNDSDYDISSFLVGTLHFVTNKRRGMNEAGQPTLEAIGEKKFRRPRKYTGHLGENDTREIDVDFLPERSVTVLEDLDESTPTVITDITDKTDDEVIQDAVMRTGRVMADVLSAIPQPKISTGDVAQVLAPIAAVSRVIEPNEAQMENMVKGISTLAAGLEAHKHAVAEQIRENSRREKAASADDTSSEQDAAEEPEKKTTVIHQQTNVIQNGNNNVNVTNNGTMNFNFGGGDK